MVSVTMLPSSNQTLVVSEMNCLRDDWIPSREPPFRKEVYVVLVPCFLSSTFLYVHSRNMFSCLVLNYGSTSTTPPCLTQYSRVKLAISRSLSTSSHRAHSCAASAKFQYCNEIKCKEMRIFFWYQRDS